MNKKYDFSEAMASRVRSNPSFHPTCYRGFASLRTRVNSNVRRHENLSDDESFRFNMLVRYMANHLYKLFRLYQAGIFPAEEWKRTAREGAQIFFLPGGVEFR